MSNIKRAFISRFPQGKILEADFSQLEIIGLAVLTQDRQLIQDIKEGVDLHSGRASELFGIPLDVFLELMAIDDPATIKKRKIAKALSFQLQYGAGATSMAESNGVSKSLAEKFIANYYERYPSVKVWQDTNIDLVNRTKEPDMTGNPLPSGEAGQGKTKMGFPRYASTFNSPTGRKYVFSTYDAPDYARERGEHTTFSPTQIKNYPVQGFSTGDLVPLAFSAVHNRLMRGEYWKDALLINTIHDSLIFDVNAKVVDIVTFAQELRNTLQQLPLMVTELWPHITFDLPTKVDVEWGNNWATMDTHL